MLLEISKVGHKVAKGGGIGGELEAVELVELLLDQAGELWNIKLRFVRDVVALVGGRVPTVLCDILVDQTLDGREGGKELDVGEPTVAPIALGKGALPCGREMSADLPALSGDLLSFALASFPCASFAILASALSPFSLAGLLLGGRRLRAVLYLMVAPAPKSGALLTTDCPSRS